MRTYSSPIAIMMIGGKAMMTGKPMSFTRRFAMKLIFRADRILAIVITMVSVRIGIWKTAMRPQKLIWECVMKKAVA